MMYRVIYIFILLRKFNLPNLIKIIGIKNVFNLIKNKSSVFLEHLVSQFFFVFLYFSYIKFNRFSTKLAYRF